MVDFLAHIPAMLAQAQDMAIAAGTAVPTPEPQSPWLTWISEYGAVFIFVAFIVCGVGLHVSEDFLLIPAGVAIYEGHMTWTETILAAHDELGAEAPSASRVSIRSAKTCAW